MIMQGKVWGWTSELLNMNNISVHFLWIKEETFCSKHFHVSKYNMFFVINGRLKVKIWKEYNLIDEIILGELDSTIVVPGQYHQFEAMEDVNALEIYWTELRDDDIQRESVGGKKE